MEKELPAFRTSQQRKLETKGCCFFCLTVTEFKAEVDDNTRSSVTSNKEIANLKSLQRYLQINAKRRDNGGRKIGDIDIEADLCESCGRIFNFSKLFSSLEKLEMEMHYWLERIQYRISEASKKPELVQTYSKSMTSDAKALAQLVFVDNLRKEIAKKSPKTKWILHPIMQLSRLDKAEIEKYSRNSKPEVSSSASKPSYSHIESNTENEEFDFEDNYSLTWDNEEQHDSGVNLPATVSSQSGSNDNNKIVIKQDIHLNVEQRLHKNLSGTHKCDKCGSLYSSKQYLKGHMQKCDGTKSLRARPRSYSFYDAKTKKNVCTKCKKAFSSSSNAALHYHSIHLQTKYKCDSCKRLLRGRSTFLRHQKTCKSRIQTLLAKGEPDPRFRHNCPTCAKGFAQRSNMENHRKVVHLKQKNYVCNRCEKQFSSFNCLKQHKNKIHFENHFDCKLCKERFESKQPLSLHQKKCARSVKVEPEMDI